MTPFTHALFLARKDQPQSQIEKSQSNSRRFSVLSPSDLMIIVQATNAILHFLELSSAQRSNSSRTAQPRPSTEQNHLADQERFNE